MIKSLLKSRISYGKEKSLLIFKLVLLINFILKFSDSLPKKMIKVDIFDRF
jgi:hypothetical protein